MPCSCKKSILTSPPRAVTSSLPNCFPSLVSYAPDHNTLEVPIQTRKLREHRVSLVLYNAGVHTQGLLYWGSQCEPRWLHITQRKRRAHINFYGRAEGEREKKKVAWPHVLAVCMSRLAPAFRPFSCSSQTDFLSPPTNNPHHRSSSSIAPAPFDVQRHLISLRPSLLCKETGNSFGLLLRRPPRSVTTTGRQLTSRVILISLAGPALCCAADVCINDLHHSFTARLAL